MNRFDGRKKPVDPNAKPEWWTTLKDWVTWVTTRHEPGETDYEMAQAVNNLFSLLGTRDEEVAKLKAERDDYKKALEFYADGPNHGERRDEPFFRKEFGCGCCARPNNAKGDDDWDFDGDVQGLTAREVLEKWKK